MDLWSISFHARSCLFERRNIILKAPQGLIFSSKACTAAEKSQGITRKLTSACNRRLEKSIFSDNLRSLRFTLLQQKGNEGMLNQSVIVPIRQLCSRKKSAGMQPPMCICIHMARRRARPFRTKMDSRRNSDLGFRLGD